MADFHIGYVPFHGKLALFGKHTIHFDFHILLGVAVAMVQSDSDDLAGTGVRAVDRHRRTDLLERSARAQHPLPGLPVHGADAQRVVQGVGLEVEESFRNHITGLIGLSVFFPADVRVSR